MIFLGGPTKRLVARGQSLIGFVQAYIRLMFEEGPRELQIRRPRRQLPRGIEGLDDGIIATFKDNKRLVRRIEKARKYVRSQGLPS